MIGSQFSRFKHVFGISRLPVKSLFLASHVFRILKLSFVPVICITLSLASGKVLLGL